MEQPKQFGGNVAYWSIRVDGHELPGPRKHRNHGFGLERVALEAVAHDGDVVVAAAPGLQSREGDLSRNVKRN